jgi:lipopolysaccharide export system protein LptA
MNFWRNTLLAAGMAVCTAWGIVDTQAQTPALKDFFGFPQNRDKPLEIEADLAEPEDGGVERYGGNESWVSVRLGDITLKCRFFTVYYERGPGTADKTTADLRKVGLTYILKLEASGNVLLTHRDQTATGDKAVFIIRANRVWFEGNVALAQEQNVLKGEWLFANVTTGDVAVRAPRPWEVPSKPPLKGAYPPVYEIWGEPKPKDAR